MLTGAGNMVTTDKSLLHSDFSCQRLDVATSGSKGSGTCGALLPIAAGNGLWQQNPLTARELSVVASRSGETGGCTDDES